jgi:hypothetical protein
MRLPNYIVIIIVFGVSGRDRMCCPWWQRQVAAVTKTPYTKSSPCFNEYLSRLVRLFINTLYMTQNYFTVNYSNILMLAFGQYSDCATSWTTEIRFLAGKTIVYLRNHIHTGTGTDRSSYPAYTVISFSDVKRMGVILTTHIRLVPRS